MNKQELAEKITKMEAGLSNPNITDPVKESLKKSIAEAKRQLATLEEKEQKPEKLTKKAFYELADQAHPKLTRNGLNALSQKEYDAIYRKLSKLAEDQGLSKKEARDYVDTYIARHLPAGEKKAEAKPAEKVADQPATPKAEEILPLYNWKSKVELSKLKPVVLHCQHYSLAVEEATPVKLKGSGNDSILVTAQPGEHLIFDDKGYPVFIMNKGSFARKCNEGTTVDAHEATKHLADKAKKLEVDLRKEQADSKSLQEEIDKLKDQLKKEETPASKPRTQPAKQEASEPAKQPAKKPVCTLDEAETGRRIAKVARFFLDEAEAWNNSQSTRKITKVMRTKGDKQEIIIEVADYRGFATGLATLIGGSRKYYRLCVDSFNLTTVTKPKVGTYSIVIPYSKMKEVYTTRGAKQYKICLQAYRTLLQCSFEGTCTKKQEAKWKTLYQECGDLVAKLDKNPEVLRNFHREVKKRRKANERYSEAMSRVAGEIKIKLKVS